MTRTEDRRITGSTSREIAGSVETLLADGSYPVGARLPTVRALAGRLGVSPGTVATAYRSLSDRGLVTGRGRGGTTVAPRRERSLPRSLAIPASGLLDLASGNPDRALLPELPPVLAELARDLPDDGRSRGYGEPAVLPALAHTLRHWIEAGGGPLGTTGTTGDHGITVTGGILDGLDRCLRSCLRPGATVLVEDPTHAGLLDLIDVLGLTAVGIPVDHHGLDPEALAERLARSRAPRPEAVVLTPRAQNPTGASLTADRARALQRVLTRYPEILVVENDYLGTLSGVPLSSVIARGGLRRWIHLHGLSKMLGPDLRIAGLTGDPASVERIRRHQRSGTGWVPWLVQRIADRILTDSAFGTQVVRSAAVYARRRESLAEQLEARAVSVTPGHGLHLWVEVPAEARVAQGALAAKIAVRPGESFRLNSPPAIRLTTATLAPALAPKVATLLAPLLTGTELTEPWP